MEQQIVTPNVALATIKQYLDTAAKKGLLENMDQAKTLIICMECLAAYLHTTELAKKIPDPKI